MSSSSQPSKQLELWTKQQREFQNAVAAADTERGLLMERLQQTKSRSVKIRHATLQAKDALGKHHTVCHQLAAQKKQLERQLQTERAQSETCAAKFAELDTAVLAFQKQAADQYHVINKEIAQANQDAIDDVVKSYITVDSVHLLAQHHETKGAGTMDDAATAALADMKRDLAEHAQLIYTRKALTARVQSWRARALQLTKQNPSITETSLLELERNFSNEFEPNDETVNVSNDTVQLQLFYGQGDSATGIAN